MNTLHIINVGHGKDEVIDVQGLLELCRERFPRRVMISMTEEDEEANWQFCEDVDDLDLQWIEQEFGFFDPEDALMFKLMI